MLLNYIQGAMRLATYEIMEDGDFYGEIPGFDGVWASNSSLEGCRQELQDALEGWLVLGLRLGHELPVVADIDLLVGAEVN